MQDRSKTIQRKLMGIVVSDKMLKTIVVRVETKKWHKLYKKQYRSSRNYQVHDEKGQFKVGEQVSFAACRPLSKNKCWRVLYQN